MSNDFDFLSRLVDYHDHIATPPVPVVDDLRRGQQRVRRNRGLLAGGAAVVVASAVAAVALVIAENPAGRPEPADRPGLSTPLVAPESVLDVREVGFHVEPVEGVDPEGAGSGWSLQEEGQHVTVRWNETDAIVRVEVLYPGLRDDSIVCTERQEDVAIHGVLGCYVDRPEDGVDNPTGVFEAHLVWEYAPDSWASVYAQYEPELLDPERARSKLLEVAEAVAPGGEATMVPIQATGLSPLVQPDTVDSISISRFPGGAAVAFHTPHLYFNVGPFGDEETTNCRQPASGGSPAPFTFGGHSGCFYWNGPADEPPASLDDSAHYIVLNVEGTSRGLSPRFAEDGGLADPGSRYPLAEVKQMLLDLTVAPVDDPSTWFDLRSAFGG